MAERILFLTGHLARPRLERILAETDALGFAWSVLDVGVKVAALMTEAIILRRLPRPIDADRVMVPGRCRADLERLTTELGVPFVRGPDEVQDLPGFFERHGRGVDLSRYDIRIFAEIVDASTLDVDTIVARAAATRAAGADVIDIGCLPDTPFPHLEDAVRAVRATGCDVSVDSADLEELRRGAKAGARFLLSLTEANLDIADEAGAVPVLVPARHGDVDSLLQAAEMADKRGIAAILDPVLDPIHFGFTNSLGRYAELRRRLPAAEILMGTGNLTELTDVDSARPHGHVARNLLGAIHPERCSSCKSVRTRAALYKSTMRRGALMFAARDDASLPKDYGSALLALHDRKPFPNSPGEIAELCQSGQGCQLPHRSRRGRYSRLQS